MIRIKLPVSPEKIRELKAGDEVSITGVMITGRDTAHKYLVETEGEDVKDLLKDSMIYHCGPVVKKEGGKYSFVAAGPTTSIREEPYEADVIEKYGVRGVIGKGGMGASTLEACGKFGSVYLSAVGGLATILARSVVEVIDVHKLEEWGAAGGHVGHPGRGFPGGRDDGLARQVDTRRHRQAVEGELRQAGLGGVAAALRRTRSTYKLRPPPGVRPGGGLVLKGVSFERASSCLRMRSFAPIPTPASPRGGCRPAHRNPSSASQGHDRPRS